MAFSNSPRIPRENLVLALDPADTNSYRRLSAVEVMVVGGGGGGGMDMGGGGGGGGVVYEPNYKVTPGTEYTVTVGAGGYGAPAGNGGYRTDGVGPQPNSHQFTIRATNGGDSVFGTIIAKGGGYGASSYYGYTPDYGYGGSGASGGGCSAYTHGGERYVDTNNIPGQGYPGGNSGNPTTGADDHYSGGGGGAGARGTSGPGHTGPNGTAGHGGDGVIIPRMSPYWYGGGGGGSCYSGTKGGDGGRGGGGGGAAGGNGNTVGYGDTNGRNAGGNGGLGNNQPGGNGGANTGGGGGGGSHYNVNNKGGEGGSGIVIVRYNGPQAATGGTYTFENGVSYHTFTSSGVFTPGTVSGNMYDVSGNKRNATVAGTAVITNRNPPILSFDNPSGVGQTDYIEFGSGNSTGFNPIYFPYVSITVAFRFNSLNDYWERIFDFGRGGNNVSNVSYNAVIFTRYSTTSDIYIYTHGSYIGYQSTSFDTGLNVDLGTWQIVTLTWQAGSQKIYKNGSLFGSWTNGYSLVDHLGPNRTDERYLLARSNWNDAGARISYGPFYIHNRILSDGEIASLHSNIKSRFGI